MTRKQLILGAAALLLLVFAAFRIVQWAIAPDVDAATHHFWCKSGHLYSYKAMAAAGMKSHPAYRSADLDSVLVCIADGCQNPSFPVLRCGQCGIRHVIYIDRWPRDECPVCHPEVAAAAAERGINPTPPGLPRR